MVDVYCGGAFASAVNIDEAAARLSELGLSPSEVREAIAVLDLKIVPFDTQALAANIREATRGRDLALGERACLLLAAQRGLPVLTADPTWADLEVGVEVRLIRG